MENLEMTYRCFCGTMQIESFHAERLVFCSGCRDFVQIPEEAGKLAHTVEFNVETERLSLVPATKKRWRELHAVMSDPANYPYGVTTPQTEKETKTRIKQTEVPRGFAKSCYVMYLICTKADNRTIGYLGLTFHLPFYSAEIGFMINESERGKGYGTEALRELTNYFLQRLGVERIFANCDEENLPCQRILEKAGYDREARYVKFYYHPERGWINGLAYAKLRDLGEP